ncbi:MAG: MFS transporter [Lautropia sp.]
MPVEREQAGRRAAVPGGLRRRYGARQQRFERPEHHAIIRQRGRHTAAAGGPQRRAAQRRRGAPPIRLAKQPDFIRFLIARLATAFAMQVQVVAVGWQIYELTGDPLQLGLVGLVQFAPSLALLFVAGPVIDRFERRRVLLVFRLLEALATLGLALGAASGTLTPAGIYAAVFVLGCARAFELPAGQALLPRLVPPELLSRAIATSSSMQQIAMIAGPAAGGVLYLAGPTVVYATSAALFAIGAALMLWIAERRAAGPNPKFSLAYLFAGFAFLRGNRALFGAVTLDMIAVLLGGATALLPIYAKDVLHTGPEGLGLLRSAPAVGAIASALWLARWPLTRHVGRRMLIAVAWFGIATLVFALSTSLALSVVALAVAGAGDMISVVVRQSLVQLETPDEMRGRVSAVNAVFIGASNQIGEFESGVVAAWVGAVGSAVIGGVGTLLVVVLWAWWFPALRDRDRDRLLPADPPHPSNPTGTADPTGPASSA